MRKNLFLKIILSTGLALLFAACSLFGDIERLHQKALEENTGRVKYTVTFDINEGSGTAPPPMTARAGSKIILPSGTGFTKDVLTFDGWNTQPDGSGDNYAVGSSWTVNGNTTLFAKWATSYTVQFNLNGGNGTTPDPKTAVYNRSITLPGDSLFSRELYTFGGWNINSGGTGSNYNAGSSYTVIGNVTLYAKWSGEGYTVTFDKNNADPESSEANPGNISVIYPATKLGGLPTPPERPHYNFTGWNTQSNGLGTPFTIDTDVTGNITVYAQWTVKTYTISFVNTGGTGGQTETVNTTYGQPMPTISVVPTTAGKIFDGYFDAPVGGKKYYNPDRSSAANWDKDGLDSYTLYAQFGIPGMVYVAPGVFMMGKEVGGAGSGDIENPHLVTLTKGFYMGKYEVTQAQYYALTSKTITDQQTLAGTSLTNNYGRGDTYPMYFVSWYEAVEFCNKLSEKEGLSPYYTIDKDTKDPNNENTDTADPMKWTVTMNSSAKGYRLPTEAEWEYAAKGGNPLAPGWVGYTYSGSDTIDDMAWYGGNNSIYGSKPVGTKLPNKLGIHDMTGNVREMCWDWARAPYPSASAIDPTNTGITIAGSFRRIRGGAWSNNTTDEQNFLRSVARSNIGPSTRSNFTGFRLVRPE